MIEIKQKPLTPLQTGVLDLLKDGARLTRAQLQDSLYGTVNNPNADRRIREAISVLRNRGHIISSSSMGLGYQLTTDPLKVRRYVFEQMRKARTLMRTAAKVRKAYGLKDQLSLSGYPGKAAA